MNLKHILILFVLLFKITAAFGANTKLKESYQIVFGNDRKPTNETVLVSFIGDILIHDDLYKKVIQSKSKDFSQLWSKIIPFFNKADFSYGNLEGPVALGINNKMKDVGDVGFTYDKIIYSGTNFLFNYHPQLIDDLKKSGIDILSTANNHTFDRGSIGIDRTIEVLKEKKMEFVGTRKKNSTDPFYKLTQIKNINIAWISCSEALNGFKDKYSQILLCYEHSEQITQIISDLKNRKDIDIIIITPHWGPEYKHEVHPQQKKHAELFLNAGATAVIGSHPHVLQPVEKYLTKDGRETFIAYSLGNFAAFQKDIDRKASAVIYLEFSKDTGNNVWISNYFYEPTLRTGTEIFPARNNAEAIAHISNYLGPLK